MIADYFEEKGMEYWLSGKNVSAGWVAIQCIYCVDSSNHLGIELATGRVSCWLCGGHGKVVNLLMDIEGCSYGEAKKILDKWWGDDSEVGLRLPPSPTPLPGRVVLPPLIKSWPQKYIDYLRGRQYDPSTLIKKYKLMPTHRFGSYGFRIIAPFFVDRVMVGFTAVDVTGKKEAKYKDSAIEGSVIQPSHCLYNIDGVRSGGKAVIVEGVTDVWRIGDGAVALGTNKINDFQLLQLIKKDVRKVLILLDSDASKQADAVQAAVAATMTMQIDVGTLDRDDPDKMSPADQLRVRKWLS